MITTKLTLYKIFRRMGVHRNEIDLSTNLNTDLCFDTYDMKVFLFFIESKFNINIDDKEVLQLQTINNTINFIENKVGRN